MDFTVRPGGRDRSARSPRSSTTHLPPELDDADLPERGLPRRRLRQGARRTRLDRPGLGPDGAAADLDAFEATFLDDLLTRAEAPIYAIATTMMVARVIEQVGSAELKAEIVPAALRGELTIALGMSEPEAGSDVAAVQTRARRDGDEWVIDGQKMFTTNGHITDYVFLLARTNPDVAEPQGPHHLPGAARPSRHRGPGRLHAVGRADEHHLLQRRAPPRPVAHRRRRRRLGAR